jgi:hypothetical protein
LKFILSLCRDTLCFLLRKYETASYNSYNLLIFDEIFDESENKSTSDKYNFKFPSKIKNNPLVGPTSSDLLIFIYLFIIYLFIIYLFIIWLSLPTGNDLITGKLSLVRQ